MTFPEIKDLVQTVLTTDTLALSTHVEMVVQITCEQKNPSLVYTIFEFIMSQKHKKDNNIVCSTYIHQNIIWLLIKDLHAVSSIVEFFNHKTAVFR